MDAVDSINCFVAFPVVFVELCLCSELVVLDLEFIYSFILFCEFSINV